MGHRRGAPPRLPVLGGAAIHFVAASALLSSKPARRPGATGKSSRGLVGGPARGSTGAHHAGEWIRHERPHPPLATQLLGKGRWTQAYRREWLMRFLAHWAHRSAKVPLLL